MSGKDRIISFRVTEAEYQVIKAEADRTGRGVSEHVRRVIIEDHACDPIEDHACDPNVADCAAHLYYAEAANLEHAALIPGSGRRIEPKRFGRAVTMTVDADDHEVIMRAADFYEVTFNEFVRQAAREKARGRLVKWFERGLAS